VFTSIKFVTHHQNNISVEIGLPSVLHLLGPGQGSVYLYTVCINHY